MRERWSVDWPQRRTRAPSEFHILRGDTPICKTENLQAAYLMAASPALYEAAKAVMSDPGRKGLSSSTLELLEEAISAAE